MRGREDHWILRVHTKVIRLWKPEGVRVLVCNFSARCEDVLLALTYLIHWEYGVRCQVSGLRRAVAATAAQAGVRIWNLLKPEH